MKNKNRIIYANEFLNRLENTVYDTPADFGYTPGLIKTVLKQTKTVDAVPVVHGRWEKKTADWVYYYACSECGEPVPSGQWGNDFFSNYCPNCGAKMDGERKDNEQA